MALRVVLVLGVGTVSAAIPNSDGKYYACRVKDTGGVRLISYPEVKTRKSGEKLINWNARGPVGPAGPADWNAIPNKQAGFADGVDNEGITAVRIMTVTPTTPTTIAPRELGEDTADCPAGFLAVEGGYVLGGGQGDLSVLGSQAIDADTRSVLPVMPNTLTIAAKSSDFGPKSSRCAGPTNGPRLAQRRSRSGVGPDSCRAEARSRPHIFEPLATPLRHAR